MNDDLPPGTEAELASCEAMIESWLASLEVDSPVVAAVHSELDIMQNGFQEQYENN